MTIKELCAAYIGTMSSKDRVQIIWIMVSAVRGSTSRYQYPERHTWKTMKKKLLNPNPTQKQIWVAVRAWNPISCKSSTQTTGPHGLLRKQSFLQFSASFLHSLEDVIKRRSQFAIQPITFFSLSAYSKTVCSVVKYAVIYSLFISQTLKQNQ